MKWLLAMVFINELPWRQIYSVLGIYGTIIVYLMAVWGEIALYAWVGYRLWGRWCKDGQTDCKTDVEST